MPTIGQFSIEFKNKETSEFFEKLLAPQVKKVPRPLAPKVAYQKWINGKPVYTLITRD